MPIRLTLRMQFGPHQDAAAVAGQLTTAFAANRADELMAFAYAEEMNDGHDELPRVREWLAHIRAYAAPLRARGIELSLNPWHTLLHADRGRRLKPSQRWQTMVDPRGRAATAVVCPLDPAWRAYIDEVIALFAAERFRVVWLDDDIRLHNHAPLEWGGCFCPLHLAEFARRTGASPTREELVAACLAPGEPHAWRGQWMDMWESTHLAMIARWRDLLAPGGTRLGLMSSSMDSHTTEGRRWADWWRALAGDRPAVHRPHFWGYGDWMGWDLPGAIAALEQNRDVQESSPGGGAALESGPEIECFPYGRWVKSLRQLGAHCAIGVVGGGNALNVSVHDFSGNDPGDEPERDAWLGAARPALDHLAEAFPRSMRAMGVGLPWREDAGRRVRLPPDTTRWGALGTATRPWSTWLGAIGVPFATRAMPVNALTGDHAWAYDDAEIERWLAGGLLLDNRAAEVLVERGFGALLGVRSLRRIDQDSVCYAMERCLDPAFALRVGADININLGGAHSGWLLQAELASEAHVISDLRDPRGQTVGHGQWLFENARGGRVAVVPWSARTSGGAPPMYAQRAAQLSATIAWLDRGRTVGRVTGGPWLVPSVRSDGKVWATAVWNASPDDITRLEVTLPAAAPAPTSAMLIDADGAMHRATLEGKSVRLPRPMRQWEMVLVR